MSTMAERMRAAAVLLQSADFDFNDEAQDAALVLVPRLRADADELERVEEELRRAWNAERPFGAPQLYRVAADRIRGEVK